MLPPFCWLGFAVGDVAWRGPAERTERPMRNSPRANRSRRPVLKRNVLVGRTEDREQKWIGRHFFKKKFAPTRSSSSFCCLLMKKETSFKWQFLLGFLCPFMCVCVCVCVCVFLFLFFWPRWAVSVNHVGRAQSLEKPPPQKTSATRLSPNPLRIKQKAYWYPIKQPSYIWYNLIKPSKTQQNPVKPPKTQ